MTKITLMRKPSKCGARPAGTAPSGADGELIAAGQTGRVVEADGGAKAFAGLAPDLFAGDAKALGEFRTAFFDKETFHPEAFQNRQNFFAGRNVTAIVLEVPTALIGKGLVHGWATASLHGHAPEVQVSRWGLPLITNIFMLDPAVREDFNRATPARRRLAVFRADRGRCDQVDATCWAPPRTRPATDKFWPQKLCP